MRILRDLLHRGPIGKFYDSLSPIDRATFVIVAGLAFALAVSVHGLWAKRTTSDPAVPALVVPPIGKAARA